jgi:intergrase/recombinase
LAKNKKDYFNKIQLALKDGWNYEKVKKTYRWLSLVYGKTSITFQGKNKKLKKVVRKKKATFIDYIYKFIPSQTKRFIVNLLVMIPGFNIGKKQKEDCRRQLTEKVDISKVDKMLNNSGDTLVDVNEILANKITGKDEDFFIRGELKRLYKFMYDSEFNDTLYIKKGSLRYNLKKAIINK